MSNRNIHQSQQESQGITIGTQGNEDITVPEHGRQEKNDNRSEKQIPNQEKSSAGKNKDANRED